MQTVRKIEKAMKVLTDTLRRDKISKIDISEGIWKTAKSHTLLSYVAGTEYAYPSAAEKLVYCGLCVVKATALGGMKIYNQTADYLARPDFRETLRSILRRPIL